MKIELDISKIVTAIILGLVMYIGKTVHDLEINQKILQYQMQENNRLFQELYERTDKLYEKYRINTIKK